MRQWNWFSAEPSSFIHREESMMSDPSILRKMFKFHIGSANSARLTLGYGDGQPGGATVKLGDQQQSIPGPGEMNLQLAGVELPAAIQVLAGVKDTQSEHNRTSMTVDLVRDDGGEQCRHQLACEAPEDGGEVLYDITFVLRAGERA